MGAWGTGIFDNDDAADWLIEFEDRGAIAVDHAFLNVTEAEADGYIEVDVGSAGLAAAEAVAFAHDRPSPALHEAEAAVLVLCSGAVRRLPEIRPRAVAAIDLIMDGPERSELLGLWTEAGDVAGPVFATVANLRERLN